MRMNLNIARQAISDSTTAEDSVVSSTISQIHPAITMHLLGDFQLILGHTPLMVLDVPRLQSLLAYLALHSHAPQLEEEGDYQIAIRIAQRLLRHDSLEEPAYRSLIR